MAHDHAPITLSRTTCRALRLLAAFSAAALALLRADLYRRELPVTARVTSCAVEMHCDNSSCGDVAVVAYRYTWRGLEHAGRGTSGSRCEPLPAGRPITAWVDPRDPAESHLSGEGVLLVVLLAFAASLTVSSAPVAAPHAVDAARGVYRAARVSTAVVEAPRYTGLRWAPVASVALVGMYAESLVPSGPWVLLPLVAAYALEGVRWIARPA